MQPLHPLWGKYGSLTCWVVFGLAAIIAAQLSMNALLDTNLVFLETERAIAEPVPRKAAMLPDTSTWQTYRNEQYGFEVKYPVGVFLVNTASTTLNFFSNRREYSGIEVGHFVPVSQCFDDGLREYCPPGFSDAVVSLYAVDDQKFTDALRAVQSQWGRDNVTTTSIAGLEGFFVENFLEYAAQTIYFIPFPNQQKTMVIVKEYLGAIPTLQDKGILPQGENLLDRILSTFKFIEPAAKEIRVDVDKSSYTRGETVKITITNSTLKSFLYGGSSSARLSPPFISWVERWQETTGTWYRVRSCLPNLLTIVPDRELEPYETVADELDTELLFRGTYLIGVSGTYNCTDRKPTPDAVKGTYRIIFATSEPQGTFYSATFELK